MVWRRPSSPRPTVGNDNANSFSNSSGLLDSTRAFLMIPFLLERSSPAALDGIASSASRMKGMIRDLTASMSYQRDSMISVFNISRG